MRRKRNLKREKIVRDFIKEFKIETAEEAQEQVSKRDHKKICVNKKIKPSSWDGKIKPGRRFLKWKEGKKKKKKKATLKN
ncbi:hypothetical protein OSSY52_06480 [Tepiditoga spiralis]|uniref:Uncharacterized protein n=1 Tax=Tepiditoga spiralis TaxID=2108365 RepID=A0A7G1G6J6_9BACT|nr:hypothetical protein [Tepiditoga spiralis]BBE30507.1 hypothetical protein OSSY52_06480 [Tepiditoga spiralis]